MSYTKPFQGFAVPELLHKKDCRHPGKGNVMLTNRNCHRTPRRISNK